MKLGLKSFNKENFLKIMKVNWNLFYEIMIEIGQKLMIFYDFNKIFIYYGARFCKDIIKNIFIKRLTLHS